MINVSHWSLPQYLLIAFYSGHNESKAISPYGPTGDYWTPGFKKGGAVETKRPASRLCRSASRR